MHNPAERPSPPALYQSYCPYIPRYLMMIPSFSHAAVKAVGKQNSLVLFGACVSACTSRTFTFFSSIIWKHSAHWRQEIKVSSIQGTSWRVCMHVPASSTLDIDIPSTWASRPLQDCRWPSWECEHRPRQLSFARDVSKGSC